MMDKKELLLRVAAILTTLNESDWSPETMLYLGTGSNLDEWMQVKFLLVSSGMVTAQHDTLAITDKGRELANRINAIAGKGA